MNEHGIEFRLGQIMARLDNIDGRLKDGSENFDTYSERLLKLELVEARRTGVIAAIVASVTLVINVAIQVATKKLFG